MLKHLGLDMATAKTAIFRVRKLKGPKRGAQRWRDYEVMGGGEVARFPAKRAVPYAFDLEHDALVFTMHREPAQLLDAPFIYGAQRNGMKRIGRVGFAELDTIYGQPGTDVRPLLIFSIGRTGSTLFNALLRCLVDWSVSEPDPISQLALLPGGLSALPAERQRFLVWHSLSAFFKLAGTDDIAVKFRSQINAIPAEVAGAFPRARYVFMVRERRAWAMSCFRAFGLPPRAAVARLAEGIAAIQILRQSGVDLTVLRYEDILERPVEILGKLARPGLVIDAAFEARVAEVMGRDSQAGTQLDRTRIERATPEEEAEWLEKFEAHWAKVRPAEVPDGVPEYLI